MAGHPGCLARARPRRASIHEAQMLTDDDVIVALGGMPEKRKMCSLMGTSCLQEAIKDYLQKKKDA